MRARTRILTAAVVGGILVGIYKLGISDEAKQSVRDAVNNTSRMLRELQEKLRRTEHRENKEQELRDELFKIRRQWESLGY